MKCLHHSFLLLNLVVLYLGLCVGWVGWRCPRWSQCLAAAVPRQVTIWGQDSRERAGQGEEGARKQMRFGGVVCVVVGAAFGSTA